MNASLQDRFATIYGLLTEGREDFIKKNMGEKLIAAAAADVGEVDIDELINKLAALDPTKNKKYLQWIANRYASDDFRLEDSERVEKALKEFESKKGNLEKKDLMSYKLHELEDAVGTAEVHVSGKENARQAKAGADRVYEDDAVLVLHIKTEDAAKFYGSGTRWCTAADKNNMFNYYAKSGPIYIFVEKKSGAKTQWHAASGQLKEENDANLGSARLNRLFTVVPAEILTSTGLIARAPAKYIMQPEVLSAMMKSPDGILKASTVFAADRGRRALFAYYKDHNINIDRVMFAKIPLTWADVKQAIDFNTAIRKQRWDAFEVALGQSVDKLKTEKLQVAVDIRQYIEQYAHGRSDGLEKFVLALKDIHPYLYKSYVDTALDYEEAKDDTTHVALRDATSLAAILRLFNTKTLNGEQVELLIKYAKPELVTSYLAIKRTELTPAIEAVLNGSMVEAAEANSRHRTLDVVNNTMRALTLYKKRSARFEQYVTKNNLTNKLDTEIAGKMIAAAKSGTWSDLEDVLIVETPNGKLPYYWDADGDYGDNRRQYGRALVFAAVGGHLGKWPEFEQAIEACYKVAKANQYSAEQVADQSYEQWSKHPNARYINVYNHSLANKFIERLGRYRMENIQKYVDKYSPNWDIIERMNALKEACDNVTQEAHSIVEARARKSHPEIFAAADAEEERRKQWHREVAQRHLHDAER